MTKKGASGQAKSPLQLGKQLHQKAVMPIAAQYHHPNVDPPAGEKQQLLVDSLLAIPAFDQQAGGSVYCWHVELLVQDVHP